MSTPTNIVFDIYFFPTPFSPLPIIQDTGSLQILFIHFFIQSFSNHLLIAYYIRGTVWDVMNTANEQKKQSLSSQAYNLVEIAK